MSGSVGSEFLTYFVIGGAVFVLAGVAIIVLGVRTARSWRRFVARAVVTRGQVIELRQEWIDGGSGPSQPIYKPVVRFSLPDGRSVESTCMIGTNPAPAQVGQLVDVRFDPDEPTRVALAQGAGGGGFSCLMGALGVGFVSFGSVFVAVGAVAWSVLR